MDLRRMKPVGILGTKTERYVAHALSVPTQDDCEEEGWEIAAGWVAEARETGSTAFVYCRRVEGGEEREGEWGWRVSYTDRHTPHRVFGGLAEFLDFKGDWFARLEDGWEEGGRREGRREVVDDEEDDYGLPNMDGSQYDSD